MAAGDYGRRPALSNDFKERHATEEDRLGCAGAGDARGTAAAAATAAERSSKAVTLNLVAYSTPRPVLTRLIEEFRKTPAGDDINIRASYGASSAQGQAVANGLPADGVILNTGNDINDLVDKGLINRNWDKQSYNGVVWNSVVAFGLRNGNPKKIKGWNDLVKPGVQAVTVNPFTGGIAKWNILAAYVAQRRLGRTEKQAIDYLKKFYRNNVVSQDSSGSTPRIRSSRARATSCSRSRARRSTARSRM